MLGAALVAVAVLALGTPAYRRGGARAISTVDRPSPSPLTVAVAVARTTTPAPGEGGRRRRA